MTGQLEKWMLLAIPLAPLAGALLVGLFGTRFLGARLGRRPSQWLAIAGVLVSFMLSLEVLRQVCAGAAFNGTIYTWMTLGTLSLEIGFLVDSLTALMMCVVTFISLMVHVYSIGYMAEDEGNNRFFAYISLFTFAMLMLVMANNFLQLFFGWEAVGLVSYLLIGFWYEKPSATKAGMKAFLVNRVGDFGFILGIGLLFAFAGTLDYSGIFAMRHELAQVVLPGTGWVLLTAACLCLFVGAMGKSAQFPLHVWLPDSMEGPTPISALIHAATMVTAGIFMVARLSPLFELSNTALSCMLVIGGITAFFLGLVAMVQNDIKRVIAYSTLSQLGYMTVALGASAYSVAIFHLTTHAFFKALLFLAAGSVILGMHHDQDIRNMGGLRKYMPVTAITALLASFSLAGAPFFSGFYSKESIITIVRHLSLPGAGFAFFAVCASLFVTAFYTFRLYFLVFHGQERFGHVPVENTEEHVGLLPGEKPHEAPLSMTGPLVVLAVPSVIIGFFTITPLLFGDFFGSAIVVDEVHNTIGKVAGFKGVLAMTLHEMLMPTFWLSVAGAFTAWYFYIGRPELPQKLQQKAGMLYRLLENQFYLDALNEKVFVQGAGVIGNALWKAGDVRLIDGWLVNGSAKVVGWCARLMRHLQTGYLYHYAFAMILSLLCLLLYFAPFRF